MHETLGKKAKDKVTGFAGTITGFCQYLTGCDQCLVVPPSKDGIAYPDGQWLDINRLTIRDDEPLTLDTTVDKGPDQQPPKY